MWFGQSLLLYEFPRYFPFMCDGRNHYMHSFGNETYRKVECDLLTRPFSVGVETRSLMGLHPVGESDCSRGPDEQT